MPQDIFQHTTRMNIDKKIPTVVLALLALRIGTSFSVKISSTSMEPLIKKGATVRCIRSLLEGITPGDIIAFYIRGLNKIVVHRVVEVKKYSRGIYAVTRGDSNKVNDQWIVGKNTMIGTVMESP